MLLTKNQKIVAASALVLILVFFAGIFTHKSLHRWARAHCNQESLEYINQRLNCKSHYVISKRAYKDLGVRLNQFISEKVAQGEVDSVSIYFRDLENGPTLGINEHDKFIPASLLKMPLLIAFLRVGESNPGFLETQLMFDGFPPDLQQSIMPRETIKENTYYSVNDLLRRMIVYSDNRAYNVLRKTLSEYSPQQDLFKETIFDLGILDPQSFDEETLSVKSYASIFNQLYYASFFDTMEASNAALRILAQSDFKQGIEQGVPDGVAVAHKFGERTGLPNDTKQLHDCGVVYFPENPYSLCVMTSGKDLVKLEAIIGEISKQFYKELEYRKIEMK